MLELMRFPEELMDSSDFKTPKEHSASTAEKSMARKLVESMTREWKPEAFEDDYHELLEKVIAEKIQHPEKRAHKRSPKPARSNVIDLVAMLQQSVADAKKKPANSKARPRKKVA